MKLLDTNVFVYAQGRPSLYTEPCRAILHDAREDADAYGVDVEALQELLDLYSRRGAREFGAAVVAEALAMFSDPFRISRIEIERAVGIVKRYRNLSPRDAIHAAVVLTYELEGIVSADKAFDPVAGLTRFDPRKISGR